ncbi:MAG: glycosyltransferase family 4 protein [Minwuia sp.]|uniref:glycosyltransferase family 4 protein n=1 Tax=Minwuia sp. TaxID=2493630 RepID=UPI003A8A36CD
MRIANFMDSSLAQLDTKGNLSHAVQLYNPNGIAEKVVHFTPDPADAAYAAQFREQGVEVFPYFDRTRGGAAQHALRAPGALLRVIAKLRAERIDLIRGRLPYFGSLIGCLAGRMLGIPSVVSLGGNNRIPQEREGRYYFGSRRISYGMETAVLRMCSAIIAPNAYTGDYVGDLIGRGKAEGKVTVIPWIITEPADEAPEAGAERIRECGLDPDRPIILTVGHINRYKHSQEMFEVALRVQARHPGAAQFVFCGDGPLRAEGEAKLADTADVHFLGWRPNATVLSLMRNADAVLVPMSGFVLLEAAALGAPVIASTLEWHSEMIRDGENGLLVEPEDIDGWCSRIADLLADPEHGRALGVQLRQTFRSAYSPAVALDAEAALYRRMLGEAEPAAAGA